MGAKVEDIIAASIRALIERDSALAEQMIAADREINRLEVDIDELCLQHPRAAAAGRVATCASSPRR